MLPQVGAEYYHRAEMIRLFELIPQEHNVLPYSLSELSPYHSIEYIQGRGLVSYVILSAAKNLAFVPRPSSYPKSKPSEAGSILIRRVEQIQRSPSACPTNGTPLPKNPMGFSAKLKISVPYRLTQTAPNPSGSPRLLSSAQKYRISSMAWSFALTGASLSPRPSSQR